MIFINVCAGKQSGPGIAFKNLPLLAFEVLREHATAATPSIIKVMQAHFNGAVMHIPKMPDPALHVTSIPFDFLKRGAAVKCVVLGGQQYMAVLELLSIIDGKSQHDCSKTWSRLDDEIKMELQPFLETFTFSGAVSSIYFNC